MIVIDEYSVREYQCVLTSPDSVRCTWTRPSPLPGGYDIKEYQIAYRYADGFNYFPGFGTVLNRTTLSPDAISFNIGGLQVYAGYVIELTCVMVSTGDIDIVSITTVYVITPSDSKSVLLYVYVYVYMCTYVFVYSCQWDYTRLHAAHQLF